MFALILSQLYVFLFLIRKLLYVYQYLKHVGPCYRQENKRVIPFTQLHSFFAAA